jgi:hypothetical protein
LLIRRLLSQLVGNVPGNRLEPDVEVELGDVVRTL